MRIDARSRVENRAAPPRATRPPRAGKPSGGLRAHLRPNVLVKALAGSAVTWSFLKGDDSSAAFIHCWLRDELWDTAQILGRVELVAGYVLGIPLAIATAVALSVRLGSRVAEQQGKSRPRQVAEQLSLFLRISMPPPWYYVFELWDGDRRRHAVEYLHRFETKTGAYPQFRRWLVSQETSEALSDKALFARHCRSHGVPVVDVLATARDGQVELLGEHQRLPRADLFLKPIHGAGGTGAGLWRYREDGRYESHTGVVLDEAGLLEHLRELSRREAYLVRPRVVNHPDLLDLTPGALSTVRVVTCLDEKNEVHVTHAVVRMPRSSQAIVDNFHAGGIAAMVDVETGVMGRATDTGLRRDSTWWERHPQTGARIEGRRLPLWPQVLEVSRRAHAAFPDQIAAGWDVAILAEGPALVEGNKSPDLDIVQRTHRAPVGNSKLGESLAFHLARARSLEHEQTAREGSR